MQNLYEALRTLQFGGITIYPLLILGVLVLAIVLDKAYVYWRYVKLPNQVLTLVETYGFAWSELENQINSFVPGNYFGRFFKLLLIIAPTLHGGWNPVPQMKLS